MLQGGDREYIDTIATANDSRVETADDCAEFRRDGELARESIQIGHTLVDAVWAELDLDGANIAI